MKTAFQLLLTVRDEWCMAETARCAVNHGFELPWPEDGCWALALVVAELLENAIKYADFSSRHSPFSARLSVCGEGSEAEVTLEHPVPPQSPEVKRLFEVLERLRSVGNAADAYVELLRETAVRRDAACGLGLARICYEAGCEVSAQQVDETRLRIRARVPAPTA